MVITLHLLHLWTLKTPTSWAVMSDKDDADWALSVPKGVIVDLYTLEHL